MYKAGNITRIFLQDFLTYDEIQVYPTPHLNVIIGPNTSGKSSVLCAICIGLNGKPEVTGRGKNIKEYIKHGKESAIIEIELHNEGGKNIVIRRIIMQSGKSKWRINGVDVTQAKIEAGVKELGIEVDNLCQFLPQDRVSEFAKLNKVELLLCTERAVGERDLSIQHEQLCQSGMQRNTMREELQQLYKQKKLEVSKNDVLKDQVEGILAKEDLDERIAKLKKVKLAYEYKNHVDEVRKIFSEKNSVRDQITHLQEILAPKNRKINQIEDKRKEIGTQKEKWDQQSREFLKNSQRISSKITEEKDKVDNAFQNYSLAKEENEKRESDINDLRRQLRVFQTQFEELEEVNESEISNQIQVIVQNIQKSSRKMNELISKKSDTDCQLVEVRQQLHQKQHHLTSFQDVKLRRIQILNHPQKRGLNQDVFNAFKWLQNNRQQFQAPVYDPMFCEIDVMEGFGKFLENAVSIRDLLAFVCENKDDVNKLKEIANQNHWSINIIFSQPRPITMFQPKHDLGSLKNLGFETYLKDVTIAPPAILSFLCSTYNIHNIPISRREGYENIPDNFPLYLFMMGNDRISKKQSRYDRMFSTQISVLRKPTFLIISRNPHEIESIQSDISDLHKRVECFNASKDELSQQQCLCNQELEKLRTDKRDLSKKKDDRRDLKSRIDQKEDQINRRLKGKIDLLAKKRKMNLAVKEAINKQTQGTSDFCNVQQELKNLSDEVLMASLRNLKFNRDIEELRNQMQAENEEIDAKKERYNEIERIIDGQKEGIRKVKMAIIKSTGREDLKQVIGELISECLEGLEKVEENLASLELQSESLYTAGRDVLEDYRKREGEIRNLGETIDKKERAVYERDDTLRTARENYIPKISELTNRINDHFSSYMSTLGCAGEVHLEKGQGQNDFVNYGLAIKVKFRDSEKLSDLTVHQQSGGERSLSTALYLLSLQTLTSVPFRCVDEINQGMDAVNERNMFSMLVDSTSTDVASQYFLVTPKLLPDLPYNSRVNFMVVYNGPTLTCPYRYMRPERTVKQIKQCQKYQKH